MHVLFFFILAHPLQLRIDQHISPNNEISIDDLERLYDLCFVTPSHSAAATLHSDPANRGNDGAKSDPPVPDHLAALASDIGVLTPEHPSLTSEELDDLAIVNGLTGTISYLERMWSVEREVVESEAWNYDTAVELIELGKRLRRIPYGGETSKLFDVKPSFRSFPAALSKGKQRETPSNPAPSHPQLRSVFNLHPKQSMDSWLGAIPGKSQLPFLLWGVFIS